MAPIYIGCPQNLDSSSLLILIRLTQRVSGGTVTGGSDFVSVNESGWRAWGFQCTCWTSLVSVPGATL